MKISFDTTSRPQNDIVFIDKNQFKKEQSKFRLTNFEAEKGQIVAVEGILYVGVTKVKSKNDWREIGFKLSQYLKSMDFDLVNIKVPDSCFEFVEGMFIGNYKFDKYKTKDDKKDKKENKVILHGTKKAKKSYEEAENTSQAQLHVRNWVNTPPEDANSESIEEAVRDSFHNSKIDIDVYDEKRLKQLKMNGHLAVNRASRYPAKTIKLTYTPKHWDSHHVMVGKGLTYDSGGLSLKPDNAMKNMKLDKSGSMTVWGVMEYLKNLEDENVCSKVTVYMALAENMVNGSAYKPDDILTMKNGKTVHVKNTDAEGRIVLFDNLCLAEEENPDMDSISSWATLTGSAVMQFGPQVAAMVGFNNKLKNKMRSSGSKSGELFMNAEFHKYMMDGVDDEVADLSNTGTPGMGCQKAGLFLTNAISKENKKKYLHIDIAGPAFADKPFGVNVEGATGFGVRSIINFIRAN